MDPHPSDGSEGKTAYPALTRTIHELLPEMRPREALMKRGAEHLPDDALLAIVLRSGRRGRNVVELAGDLLHAFGGLGSLSRATVEEIRAHRISGVGEVKAIDIAAAFELGRRAAHQTSGEEAPSVRDPESVVRVLRPLTHKLQQEVFWTLLLDTKNRLIGHPVEVTRGLLDASLVHPREVFATAIKHAAAAVILAHNHPSGDPTPSPEDLRITRQLIDASRILGIRILDHVIVVRETPDRPSHLSLREHGLANFDGPSATT